DGSRGARAWNVRRLRRPPPPEGALCRHDRTLTCQVQKSPDERWKAYHPDVVGDESPVRGPLPDESLDALVVVLDEVRFGRSRSRSELVARTGLGRAIVAPRRGGLLERGLVVEGDVGPSTGGRPPRQLSFRASAGHLLVADLGATSIDVALTTRDGRLLGHHDEPASIEAGPEACLGRVEELFDQLVATTHTVPGRLWGIGIGVPGPRRVAPRRAGPPPALARRGGG